MVEVVLGFTEWDAMLLRAKQHKCFCAHFNKPIQSASNDKNKTPNNNFRKVMKSCNTA